MLRLIDAFSGAGGLTLGFTGLSSRDFVSIWANDIDKDAVATYNRNFGPHCVLHPVQDRPITHREAARLQSFPDHFQFAGNKTSIAKQIGNAVPPLLAASVANCVYELFNRQERAHLETVTRAETQSTAF